MPPSMDGEVVMFSFAYAGVAATATITFTLMGKETSLRKFVCRLATPNEIALAEVAAEAAAAALEPIETPKSSTKYSKKKHSDSYDAPEEKQPKASKQKHSGAKSASPPPPASSYDESYDESYDSYDTPVASPPPTKLHLHKNKKSQPSPSDEDEEGEDEDMEVSARPSASEPPLRPNYPLFIAIFAAAGLFFMWHRGMISPEMFRMRKGTLTAVNDKKRTTSSRKKRSSRNIDSESEMEGKSAAKEPTKPPLKVGSKEKKKAGAKYNSVATGDEGGVETKWDESDGSETDAAPV